MGELTWAALQRLCDDEPPLKVWREERGFEIAALGAKTAISLGRLIELETDLLTVTNFELDRLTAVLRVPYEYLAFPQREAVEAKGITETVHHA